MKMLPSPGGVYRGDVTIYLLEADDAPSYWLHEGLAHVCSYLWRLNDKAAVLRPYKTQCGIQVVSDLDKRTANLYNLVNVEATCLWCVAGRTKEA